MEHLILRSPPEVGVSKDGPHENCSSKLSVRRSSGGEFWPKDWFQLPPPLL